jgi:IS5 family transposase
MGIFRALIIMRMKGIRSLRELCRLLDFDLRLRRLCLIEQGQRGYGRSVLSRFIAKVGAELLGRVIDEKVIKLLSADKPRGVDVVLDASFIKAYSTRDSFNNQVGYSDPDARVGRHGKTYNLGYKLHLSIDSKTMLPLASLVVSANQNEKRHSLWLLKKSKQQLKPARAKLRRVIADSQYSHRELREKVKAAIIPYPANQKPNVKGLLRVDKKFRTYGPKEQIKHYHKRPLIESVYSFLKDQYSLENNKLRGAAKVACISLISLLCHILNREAALNIGRPDKATSPTFFNN